MRALILSDRARAVEVVEALSSELDAIREHDVRLLSHRLHPSVILIGLVPALESLVASQGGSLTIDVCSSDPLSDRVAERRTADRSVPAAGTPAEGVRQAVKRGAATLALAASLLGLTGLSPAAVVQAAEPGVAKPVVNILCQFSDESNTYGKAASDVQNMFTGSSGLDSFIWIALFRSSPIGRSTSPGHKATGRTRCPEPGPAICRPTPSLSSVLLGRH